MTRIAKLAKGYYVNFDDHCLYSKENKRVAKIGRKPLEVLEYFCEYPNCYKQIEDINQYLEEGCLSSEAIRSRIFKLRESHDILREVVTHDSSGYKYIGRKTESVDDLNLNGQGVTNDDDIAFRHFQIATEQGDAVAQCYLGMMYVNGRGVPQNDAKAFEWFRQAAEHGNAVAQCYLGHMYENGRGVPQNDTKACEWYQKAADQENAMAQRNLGLMYGYGRGVPQNNAKAFEWFQKSAEQGDAVAQWYLGHMYENGRGVPQNDTKAFEWFKKAAEQGFTG